MQPQQHHVEHLNVSIDVSDLDTALRLRARAEELVRERLPHVLEQVLDAFAPTDMRVELGRLDLDLGIIAAEQLEDETPRVLERALRQALADALAAVHHAPSPDTRAISLSHAAIEDFETYLTHGIPRFQSAQPFTPTTSFGRLLAEQPDALIAMLRRRAGDRHALDRLVLQLGDDELRTLLIVLAPADAALILAYHTDLQRLYRATPVSINVSTLHRMVWCLTLEFMLHDAGTQFNRRSFTAHLLRGIAVACDIAYPRLLALMRDALAQTRRRQPVAASLPAVLDALAREDEIAEATTAAVPERIVVPVAGAEALLGRFRDAANDPEALESLVWQLSAAQFAWLIERLEPAHASLILTYVSALGALHRERALMALSPAGLERQLRLIVLRYLLREAGSQFNRRSWLRRLLSRLAAIGGVSIAFLLASLSAALAVARCRLPVEGSLPAAIAALAADLPAGGNARAQAEPGSIEALVARVRQYQGSDTEFAVLIGGMTSDEFKKIVASLQPTAAQPMLERIAELALWQQRYGLVALSEHAFELNLRLIALRWLLRDPPTRFSKAWLAQVASDMADTTGMDRDLLASWLVQLPHGLPPAGRDEAAFAHKFGHADRNERARLIQHLLPDPVLLQRVIAQLGEPDLSALITDFGAAGIAAREDLARLEQRHKQAALIALDAAAFRSLIVALAVILLAKGGPLRRAALRCSLLDGIARYQGVSVRDLGSWRQIEQSLQAVRQNGVPEIDPMVEAERFLRTGGPPSSAAYLAEAAALDPTGFSALLGRLTVAASGETGVLIERLLAWMLPDEIMAALRPGEAGHAAAWASQLADLQGGNMAVAWSRILAATLRGDPLEAATPPLRGEHHDRLALLGHWLEQGVMPWWAPPATRIEPLLARLVDLPIPDIHRLFGDADDDAVAIRLRRAVDRMGPRDGDALIRRLAPWAFGTGGPLASLAANLPADTFANARIRAAAAAISGAQIDLTRLRRAIPAIPTPPPEAVPAEMASPTRADAAELFDWLGGNGPDAPAQLAAWLRQFVDLADRSDPRIDPILHAAVTRSVARKRWSTAMTDEVFARVLARLAPDHARFYLDAMAILAAAWQQTAPASLRKGIAGRLRADLLVMLAEVPLPSPRRALARLIASMAEAAPELSNRLRAHAVQLARGSGYANIVGGLNQAPAATPPRPDTPPQAISNPSRPPEPQNGDRFYIANAGLVLFNPFLPRFFEKIGVLTPDEQGVLRVSGIEAASRAVHMLQYLVDERCDAPEHDLVLNKLLAGISVAAPVARAIELDEQDRKICNDLIKAVISNWPIIANTSPDGLRETFLQRVGRLRREEGHWTLDVERKTVDILVDQVPWSWAVVYHNWMSEPMHVNW